MPRLIPIYYNNVGAMVVEKQFLEIVSLIILLFRRREFRDHMIEYKQ